MRLRLGSISFANSLPVDLGLLCGRIAHSADIASGTPAKLNEALLRGELDVSPVSSLFFAEHADRFYLLPDVSISSGSAVDSVLLLSRKPIEDLKDARIAVTKMGRTTPVLLEILLAERV